jgi:hypothetical protein
MLGLRCCSLPVNCPEANMTNSPRNESASVSVSNYALGSDPGFTHWIYDLLCSLRPQVQQHSEALESLGDFNTLPHRLQAEVTAAHAVVPFVGLVGAWSRRPEV